MSFNGKHLSLEDRKVIEENINKGLKKFETAKELNKSQSTIGKEIKNNRKRRYSQCEKTIYTYIEMGLFKDWGVTNIDLRRKVARKISRKNEHN